MLVHEIEETHTDAMGNAWFDRRGYENADKCAWNFGTTKTASNGGIYNVTIGSRNYLIQQNWVNSGSGGAPTKMVERERERMVEERKMWRGCSWVFWPNEGERRESLVQGWSNIEA